MMMARGVLVFVAPAIFMLFTSSSHARSTRDTVLQFLKDYSPDGYHIVGSYENTPDDNNLFIGRPPAWFGSGNHMRDYTLLKGELEKAEYRSILEELRDASR